MTPKINSKLELVKTYFDWPVIDLKNSDIFFRIKTFSDGYLVEYYFILKRHECEIILSKLGTKLSVPHVPLQVLDSDYKVTKEDILRSNAKMDSLVKNYKELPIKKGKPNI